jgi:hypothetical protein
MRSMHQLKHALIRKYHDKPTAEQPSVLSQPDSKMKTSKNKIHRGGAMEFDNNMEIKPKIKLSPFYFIFRIT